MVLTKAILETPYKVLQRLKELRLNDQFMFHQ